MNLSKPPFVLSTATPALALAVAACLPMQASAQSTASDGRWSFGGTLYGFLPKLGGSSSLPVDSGGSSIQVDADQIIERLEFAIMGSFDAHNGRWGVFTDVLYLEFGDSKDRTRDFTIGNVGIPADTSARIDWNLKGLIWTLAGQYRVVSQPSITLDVIGGSRLFEMRQRVRWDISGSLGPIAPAGRVGESNVKLTNWDGIVGVKGRYAFNDRWSLPFYADIGAGESDLTQQVAAGVSYKFSWGEINAMYRYLGYEMKSGKVVNDVYFHGPMIGATFRW